MSGLLLGILLTACAESGTEPEPPTLWIQTPGEAITAEVGDQVPLRIRVVDSHGAAKPGAEIAWQVAAGSGEVEPLESMTDAEGYARATWTLGPGAGDQAVVARMVGGTVAATITAHALPGPALTLELPADTIILTAFRQSKRLQPRVTDRFGNQLGPTALAWLAINPEIVSVDTTGLITAHQSGSAAIVVRAGNLADTAHLVVDPRGAITITFDDGFRSTYTVAYPLLREHGLRANVGVVREYSELEYPSYLTLGQLRELAAAGWSMVSHSVTHPKLDSIPAARLHDEIVKSREWLDRHQLRGSSIFIVPYHSWGARELDLIKKHYQAARGLSVRQFWPDSIVQWRPADPYALTAIEPEWSPFDFTTTQGRELLRTYLDRVVASGEFVDIFFHAIVPEKEAGFRELINLLAEYGEWIRPYHELFELEEE